MRGLFEGWCLLGARGRMEFLWIGSLFLFVK
jgi:hypothetical protein